MANSQPCEMTFSCKRNGSSSPSFYPTTCQ